MTDQSSQFGADTTQQLVIRNGRGEVLGTRDVTHLGISNTLLDWITSAEWPGLIVGCRIDVIETTRDR